MQKKMLSGLVTLMLTGIICGCVLPGIGLNGSWIGTIKDVHDEFLVKLTLSERGGKLRGGLKIISNIDTNDISKGAAFEIVRVQHSGDQLQFVVPLFGQINDDAIYFDLVLKQGRLVGTWNELWPGSEKVPVVFARRGI